MTLLSYKTTNLALDDVLSGDLIDLSGVDAQASEVLQEPPAAPSWDALPDMAGALQ